MLTWVSEVGGTNSISSCHTMRSNTSTPPDRTICNHIHGLINGLTRDRVRTILLVTNAFNQTSLTNHNSHHTTQVEKRTKWHLHGVVHTDLTACINAYMVQVVSFNSSGLKFLYSRVQSTGCKKPGHSAQCFKDAEITSSYFKSTTVSLLLRSIVISLIWIQRSPRLIKCTIYSFHLPFNSNLWLIWFYHFIHSNFAVLQCYKAMYFSSG